MQLIEFFLWKNLKNKSMNTLLSKIASFIVILQPLPLILMIPTLNIRYYVLGIYFIYMTLYLMYKSLYSPIQFSTYVEKNKHLSWGWANLKGYETIFIFIQPLFYVVSLLLINNFVLSLFVILFLCLSIIFYFKNNTYGTMWCWITNLILLYFIVNILIIKPFYEYKSLC